MSTSAPLLDAAQPGAVARAVALLAAGGVVAFPTDTVYGLAASLAHPEALRRLYGVKSRPGEKPLPVLLADRSALGAVAAAVGPRVDRLLARWWPGPLTVVLPARGGLPPQVVGPGGTVGVRVPDHALARAIVSGVGGALAVTSANRSGERAATEAAQVAADLGAVVDLVLDGGRAVGGVASSVVAVRGGELAVFREGAVAAAALLAAWREVPVPSRSDGG